MCSTALERVSSWAAEGNRSVMTLRPGERGEGQRLHELLGRRGHDDLHFDVALGKGARQLGRLVGGDAAADTEQDAHGATPLRGSGSSTGMAPGSSHFTRPRRTSSMAITVGFFEVVGRKGRAPP